MIDYFTQLQMVGKLLLMEEVTRVVVADISIQDISQRKQIPEALQGLHKITDIFWKKKLSDISSVPECNS